MTLDHMHIIPRSRDTYKLKDSGEELNVNSLGFAGMLLVKSEEELDAVKNEGVMTILMGVGMRKHDIADPMDESHL